MLTSIIGVAVLLGGLIFFHELGHYLVAKFFGVRVEVFSLGFGKKILRKKWGETEYCISIIPLGGYVKLMGDDPYKGVAPEDTVRAFSTQKLYKRFLIVAAGPIFNLILAYFLFFVIFWVGQPVASNKIGSVTLASPGAKAGFMAQDRVLEVEGKPIQNWDEFEGALKNQEGKTLNIVVERGAEKVTLSSAVTKIKSRNDFGEEIWVGGISGVSPIPNQAMIGVSSPETPAGKSGLATGNIITQVQGKDVRTWDEMETAITDRWKKTGGKISLTVKTDAASLGTIPKEMNLPAWNANTGSAFGPLEILGIYPSEMFVQKVNPDSAAEKGGLQAQDRLIQIGDKKVYSFEDIVEQVQAFGREDKEANVLIERKGQKNTLKMKATETSQEDPLTRQKVKAYLFGFAPYRAFAEPEMVKIKISDPMTLISKAVSETHSLAYKMLISLGKLVTGSISVKNLGGPVLIARVAGKSLDAGIIPFLQVMALISINLFLLNLFPVPVLDGGHLLFFIIEAIKGKPVSLKTMELANQIGMVLILMLVGLTFFNDISRIYTH